ASIPEPFFSICQECLRTDPERRCTLAGIKAHLDPPQAAEVAVATPEPVLDRDAKKPYKFFAMVVGGTLIFLLFLIGAFTFGWDLTPSAPLPSFHSPFAKRAAPTGSDADTAREPSMRTSDPKPAVQTAIHPH
ncbi:MAG TPA: hypothetical protein VF730_12455, partial [Terracidiphilus sp.]